MPEFAANSSICHETPKVRDEDQNRISRLRHRERHRTASRPTVSAPADQPNDPKGEYTMRLNIVRSSLLILCIATPYIFPALGQAQDLSCSTAKAAGDWGLTLIGTLLLPTGLVPAAAIARGTFDINGNVTSAIESRNVGGGFANETLKGSWAVNSDCTGTLTAYVYQSGILVRTSVASLLFINNMNEVRMVQQSLSLPDGTALPVVITLEGKRLFPKNTNSQ